MLPVVANAGWLFADKIVRLAVGLVVWTWLARYLGPEQFGLFNYASAFVSLFAVVASLGLNSVVVRDLVKNPLEAEVTLGTAFILQLIGGAVAFGLAVFIIRIIRPDDRAAEAIVYVLGLAMVLKATEVVKYWFESKVQSKYSVWLENSAFVLFSGVRVMLMLVGASLVAFAWAVFAEGLVVAVGLLWVYGRCGGRLHFWRGQHVCAKALLRESWPLILSGLAVMLYMRIDQVMLGEISSVESVGIYSAAVRVSEVWYFVPMSIIASAFPRLLQTKIDDHAYRRRFQQLYNLMVALALGVAVPMTFLSGWIVVQMFGPMYEEAGSILSINIWAGVFVALGLASSQWLLIEGLEKVIFYRTLLGAIVNISANSALIPLFGATGAAIATVISYGIAVFSVHFWSTTRIVSVMMTKALIKGWIRPFSHEID